MKTPAPDASGRVSMVIATWNRARLLGRALHSLGCQTYGDLEIIVVDDGSTDDTAAVVRDFAGTTSHSVRYVRKENGGCASARNAGVQLATGRWLGFLDSDDELECDAVSTLVGRAIEANADFVYSPAIDVDVNGAAVLNLPVAAGAPDRFAAEHFCNTNLRTGSYLLRRELFSQIGGYDEQLRHNEDSDFVQQLALRGRATYSAQPSVRCHSHTDNKSRDRVAIYRALLHSSERTLARYPELTQQLGDRAEARIVQLRAGLANALILRGDLDEAVRLAAEGAWRLPVSTRVSLRIGSAAPVRLLKRAAETLGAARFAIGSRILKLRSRT